jgi:hypothetical protein
LVPIAHLHILTLIYIWEQLEQTASFLHAMWEYVVCEMRGKSPEEKPVSRDVEDSEEEPYYGSAWLDIGMVAAYRFRIGQEAWEHFCAGIGVDGKLLVDGNYQGGMLELAEGRMSSFSPHEDLMPEILARMGHEGPVSVMTARDLARSWKDLFEQVCRD